MENKKKHWNICKKCNGTGKITKRLSKKVQEQYKITIAQFEKLNPIKTQSPILGTFLYGNFLPVVTRAPIKQDFPITVPLTIKHDIPLYANLVFSPKTISEEILAPEIMKIMPSKNNDILDSLYFRNIIAILKIFVIKLFFSKIY